MSVIGKQRPKESSVTNSNPFDSDDDSDTAVSRHQRASSTPVFSKHNPKATPVGAGGRNASTGLLHSHSPEPKDQHNKNSHGMGAFQTQPDEELENYAVSKAKEVTKDVNACLKIAENIKEDGMKTLVTLHQQGEQIRRTHIAAVSMEQDLSRGEKLLGSLGGMFSKPWKPKRTRAITGPMVAQDGPFIKRGSHLEKRERLGIFSGQRKQSSSHQTQVTEPSAALEKVEVEQAKQDGALSDLSNVVDQLKCIAIDMGSELERQNIALDHVDDDISELGLRVDAANRRGRHLLKK